MREYHGHMTLGDGTHKPLTKDEAAAIWGACKKADAARRAAMPDTKAALHTMHDARQRLRDEGWSEGCYCPKDGTEFAVIQYGSTGIFSGVYIGEWPKGHVYCRDGIDHPSGMLWKAIDKLSDWERETMERCMKSERDWHERTMASLASTQP